MAVKLRIDEILKEKQMSKYQLNLRLQMGYKNLDNIVKGKVTSIRLDTLDKLATALDVTIGELFVQTKDLDD